MAGSQLDGQRGGAVRVRHTVFGRAGYEFRLAVRDAFDLLLEGSLRRDTTLERNMLREGA